MPSDWTRRNGEASGLDLAKVSIDEIAAVSEQDVVTLQARHDELRSAVARIADIYQRIAELDEAYTRMRRVNSAKADALQNIARMDAVEFLSHKIAMEKVEEAMRQIVDEKNGLLNELRITARRIADQIGLIKCTLLVGEYEVEYQPEWAALKITSPSGERFGVAV